MMNIENVNRQLLNLDLSVTLTTYIKSLESALR